MEIFSYRQRDPSSEDKSLIIQLIGEKVTSFGIAAAVNMHTKTIYFVGRFNYNMPTDRSLWDDYLKKKERWGMLLNSLIQLID